MTATAKLVMTREGYAAILTPETGVPHTIYGGYMAIVIVRSLVYAAEHGWTITTSDGEW